MHCFFLHAILSCGLALDLTIYELAAYVTGATLLVESSKFMHPQGSSEIRGGGESLSV